MPFPWLAAAAGASWLMDHFNTKNQNDTNFENQVKFWNMQNEYNLPTNQKQRLLDANLSPGLMYGGGGISNTASSVNPPDVKKMPTLDIPNVLMQSQQVQNMELQREQMQATVNEKKANQFKIYADTLKSLTEGKNRSFDLKQKERLADTSFQLASETLRSKSLDNTRKAFENTKMSEMQKLKAQELVSRIQLNQANMTRQQVETEIQKAEAELRRMGTSFKDSFIIRDLVRGFNGLFGNPYEE